MNYADQTAPYMSLNHINKCFGPTKALQDMSLRIYPGQIIGLVGPNGAGKSTLMKIMTGIHEPTSGTIMFAGKENVAGKGYNPNAAKAYGISCAYQELSLCSNLTVYENFMINHMDHKPFGKPGWRRLARLQVEEYLSSIFPNHGINVRLSIGRLSSAQKQMVEITKAISYKGLKVLILDEPTSSLSGKLIEQLHDSMKGLAAKGVAIIYISHKLNEIEKICDKVVVMKEGATSWSGDRSDTSMKELVEILGGKVKISQKASRIDRELEDMLQISGLCTSKLHDISISVKRGEMIGISGLEGAGQKELIAEIFKAAGKRRKKAVALKTNVCYISGDRQNEGVFPLWGIADNIVISSLKKLTRSGLVSRNKLKALAAHWYDKLKFIARGIHDDITNLSGGNQQKALLARGLAADAGLILLNDPTCGVDIETKQEIYKLLEEAKGQGRSIILYSTEDLEMEQCGRVYVMHEGKIVAELQSSEVTVKNIIGSAFLEKSKASDCEIMENIPAQKHNLPGRIVTHRAFLAFATLITIFIINAALNPRILSYMGIELLFSSSVPLIFMALGQMFIVISGDIDLGNGQALGLMNVIVAFAIANRPGLGLLFTLLFILGYGLLAVIIYFTKIPAIVITLGASFVWLGVALLVSSVPGGQAPVWLKSFCDFSFPLIPMPIIISIAAALLAFWLVKRWKYGMIINGMGSNPAAIARAGWSQLTAKIVTYMLSGGMVVLAGLMLTAISNSGDCNATQSYCMLSIATIILGGCAFSGGVSSPVGVVVAALAISSISFLLTFIGIDSNLQSAVTGLILIIALAMKLFSGMMEARR